MSTADQIITEFTSLFDMHQAEHLAGFFKTGKWEYGEGDKFLGIKVPVTREIVKRYRESVSINDVQKLIDSEWHEIRLAGFLLLIELYKASLKSKQSYEAVTLVNFYLLNLDKGNNWDLVDLVAPNILGDWVLKHPEWEKVILELSESHGKLWRQRVAIVSTFALIKAGKYQITFDLASKYLTHRHDLIHKATGWMLREIGKRGGKEKLVEFLESNKTIMPRTMLRYAIERFSPEEKVYFMSK